MSARKAARPDGCMQVSVEARETHLALPPEVVVFRKNGIEFLSPTALPCWKEMTLTLCSPGDKSRVTCTGVVVSCTGNRHTGYHISLLFTELSPQAQMRLSAWATFPPQPPA
ncbi:MAG: hypothetical protein RMN51_02025 [Verrucomicrobiota bacterium]|nr:hypothetical protein [Limisphaera sp.]MDW8380876.1 hypothetical protein [Verrucomicrobiota bacterium]